MPIPVACTACGQSFAANDELAGTTTRCPCGQPLRIPAASNALDWEEPAPGFSNEPAAAWSQPGHPLSPPAAPRRKRRNGKPLLSRLASRRVVGLAKVFGGVLLVCGLLAGGYFAIRFAAGPRTALYWFYDGYSREGVRIVKIQLSNGTHERVTEDTFEARFSRGGDQAKFRYSDHSFGDASRNMRAALAAMGPDILPVLEEVIDKHPNEATRWHAVHAAALVHERDSSVSIRSLLLRASVDRDATVRESASQLLRELEPSQATHAPSLAVLISRVTDKDAGVRKAALRSLALLGPNAKPAVPALGNVLDDPAENGVDDALKILHELGPAAEPAASSLVRLIARTDPGDEQYEMAASILRAIGPAAIPALHAALSQAGTGRTALADRSVDDRAAVVRLLEMVKRRGELGKELLPLLLAEFQLNADVASRIVTAEAVTAIAPRDPAAIPSWIELLDRGNVEQGKVATRALAEFGPAAHVAVGSLVYAHVHQGNVDAGPTLLKIGAPAVYAVLSEERFRVAHIVDRFPIATLEEALRRDPKSRLAPTLIELIKERKARAATAAAGDPNPGNRAADNPARGPEEKPPAEPAGLPEGMRIWTAYVDNGSGINTNVVTAKARYLRTVRGKVQFELEDGKRSWVPLKNLSPMDQKLIERIESEKKDSARGRP